MSTEISTLGRVATPHAPGQSVIRLDGVKKSFATKEGRFDAVRGVSLDIAQGSTFGIIGKS
ncbi:MAG: methionine ABC transporter ATP-binding protein, partial [Achromobacter sp.]